MPLGAKYQNAQLPLFPLLVQIIIYDDNDPLAFITSTRLKFSLSTMNLQRAALHQGDKSSIKNQHLMSNFRAPPHMRLTQFHYIIYVGKCTSHPPLFHVHVSVVL